MAVFRFEDLELEKEVVLLLDVGVYALLLLEDLEVETELLAGEDERDELVFLCATHTELISVNTIRNRIFFMVKTVLL